MKKPILFSVGLWAIAMLLGGKIWGQTRTEITSLNDITDAQGSYTLSSGFSTTGTAMDANNQEIGTSSNPFKGTIDGQLVTITGTWNKPLFDYVEDATIKNVIIQSVNINVSTANTNVGAITGNAKGETRIYNCGVLDGNVGGTNNVGGLVGKLYEKNEANKGSRVINCFSYATITGGTNVAGIVGYNNFATKASDIRTMVMNCMFYGDITGGSTKSPVYGGTNINNLQGGLNTFNYYAYEQLPTGHITSNKYNCALAVEEKYLNRFEFYRLLLNSNKKLAAFYITGNPDNADLLAKWVLETADRTNSNPYPYPILKSQGYYPSIINPDFANAPDSTSVGPNKGGKLGKTLSVTIDGVGSGAPSGASITTSSLTLQRTDKDFDRFNFNYDKVQLPYYNDVGTGNYTGNRVVTGWKITAITPVDNDPYTAENYDYTKDYSTTPTYFDYPNYNFADRKSSNKDLYSVSGRVFSQGAYFDVPYGVTSITIEPYWAKAVYIADPNYDVVYKTDYKDTNKQNVTQTGTQVNTSGTSPTTFNGQKAETSIERALNYIANTTTGLGGLGPTVYDNALVLMGNLHLATVPQNGTNPFTMMSMDMDNDHEPDYSLIYHHIGRSSITPIRFDFLNIPGTAQAQKPNGANLICNFTIFKTRGWFEVTNTAFMYSNQVEYENLDNNTKLNAPLILLGGIFDQFVSTQSKDVLGNTIYIHLGGNLWIDQFGMGTHGDGSKSTPHVPVSVTGGDYVGFYLTGTYNKDANVKDDNAECYISGGRFAELAGACQEQIGEDNTTKGNVHWQIYNADITEFFGGGINDAKPVKGNITTDIFNSRVGTFCGGPKFGNMAANKTVTTTAEGCTFNKFFGAGYGGLSYAKKKYYDLTTYNWNTLQGYYTSDRGKYYDGITTNSSQVSGKDYGKKGPGVATDFDYEFFVWSSGQTGARFYVKFASFSLAQCNNVTSTLIGCTINDNFYGGGSLGKVAGDVTSILENCTVKGNVFGAGFSATLPTIEVRDAGFTTNPNFNSASGMFEPGVFSGTTTFTWQHKDSYPQNNSAGFLTDEGAYSIQNGTSVVTTVDITSSNLGSVAGAVSLTLKGNTTVGTEGVSTTGNVYGGGAMSAVNSDVSVTLQGTAEVMNNVYGGGDQGTVGGNTTVKLKEGARILGNVFGGGNEGPVGGNSEVIIQDDPEP